MSWEEYFNKNFQIQKFSNHQKKAKISKYTKRWRDFFIKTIFVLAYEQEQDIQIQKVVV